MRTRIINYWEKLRAAYWFYPALLVGLAIALSILTTWLDQLIPAASPAPMGLVYIGDPDGARTLLSTIAGSMINVAGVTFSIVIVALTLASSQFGPRLLTNFMRDRGNQVTLGMFLANFTYSLLILRTIGSETGGGGNQPFMPYISIAVALLWAMAGVVVLIYFIHHVATSIQADYVIAAVGRELDQAIARFFPEEKWYRVLEQELRREDDIPADFDAESCVIEANQNGYLQAIDYEGLMKVAAEHDFLLRLQHRPGDFVAKSSELTILWPAQELDEQLTKRINNAFITGVQRQRTQDVEFAINQLVEIALRALSPGINDPFTAIACIDRLGASLIQLAERQIPSGYLYDNEDKLRLISDAVTFSGIVETAFNQIRQNGRSSAAVTIRLLETIALIATRTKNSAHRASLLRQAVMIKRGSEDALPEESDRKDVARRYELVRQKLEQQHAANTPAQSPADPS